MLKGTQNKIVISQRPVVWVGLIKKCLSNTEKEEKQSSDVSVIRKDRCREVVHDRVRGRPCIIEGSENIILHADAIRSRSVTAPRAIAKVEKKAI